MSAHSFSLYGLHSAHECPALAPSRRERKGHRRRTLQLILSATTRTYQPTGKPLVKICGVTNPGDAELASKAGADFVGMILWQKARRAVTPETAAKIAATARRNGAEPVAVFVDEDFQSIVKTCRTAGIEIAQLHGSGARRSLQDLPSWLKVVYVMHAAPNGVLQTKQPPLDGSTGPGTRQADWLLIDGLKAGSGETYDWESLRPPLSDGMQGWLLAGGLDAHNVGAAIRAAKPTGVDVSSGVSGPDGLLKDPDKVFSFIEAVRRTAVDLEKEGAAV